MPALRDSLIIDFVIIGGGVAGLTAAIALRRVGHRVTLLEQDDDFNNTRLAGGCRLAPNMVKIFYQWGMEDSLKKSAVVSQFVQFVRYDTGRATAGGEWVDDFRTESGGEFLSMHYSDFRRVLYESAIKHGARIRALAKVKAIHVRPQKPSVVLESGEEIYADVLVGADGTLNSLTRRTLLGKAEREIYKNVMMYNTIIPASEMTSDPTLAQFLTNKDGTVSVWYGDSFGVMGFLATEHEFSIHVYAPRDKASVATKQIVHSAELLEALTGCEPRLRKLAQLAHTIIAVPVTDKPHLEDWVHPSGPLVIIGETAHPLTAGNLYALSLAAEDGMMLGRLFHHLHRKEQIQGFLSALSEQRNQRIAQVQQVQRVNPITMGVPAGVEQARYLKTTVEHMDNAASNRFTEEAIRTVFSYDPEEAADDWWVEWGLLQERASRTVPKSAAITVDIQK